LIDLKAPRVLLGLPALVRYLRRERPAALLSVLHANLVALWGKRLAGIPMRVVLAEHNTLSSVSQGMRDIRWRLYPLPARVFYPWADRIIAVSTGVADDLASMIRIPRERIQVVYNPIVTPELREKSSAPVEHPWFQKGEPPVVLAVGRLTKQKAFDVLLQAFAKATRNCTARLMILGEGEERLKLEALVKDLGLAGVVSLPGFLPNPYAFMAHAAVFVLSSRWEGLPTVMVEALAVGLPIISTDCPSGPREILSDGKFGQLVPVEDPEALAQAIEMTLGGNGLRPPKDCWAPYELEHVVDQYINVLTGS
jgi:glycosyltransferase involved in cell wall biosynthesis